jgi:uncharacterized coiled-coil DUF342 family protein
MTNKYTGRVWAAAREESAMSDENSEWTDEEIAEMMTRPKPVLEINRIRTHIDAVKELPMVAHEPSSPNAAASFWIAYADRLAREGVANRETIIRLSQELNAAREQGMRLALEVQQQRCEIDALKAETQERDAEIARHRDASYARGCEIARLRVIISTLEAGINATTPTARERDDAAVGRAAAVQAWRGVG